MKKFHLHADALICLVVVILASLAGNLFLFLELRKVGTENIQMHIQAELDALNLASKKHALTDCKDRLLAQDAGDSNLQEGE